MRFFAFCGLTATIFLMACSERSVVVQKITDQSRFTGLSYFLPRGIVELTISRKKPAANGAAKIITLEVSPVRYVADAEYHYAIHQDHNVFFNDKIVVQVSEDGLLSSINSDTKDETPEIVRRIAGAPVEILRAPSGFKSAADDGKQKNKYQDYEIKFALDPTDPDERYRLNQILRKVDPKIKFSAKPLTRLATGPGERGGTPDCNLDPCFRPGIPFALELIAEGITPEAGQPGHPDPTTFEDAAEGNPAPQQPQAKAEVTVEAPQPRATTTAALNASAPDSGLVVARSIVVLPTKYAVGQVALTRAPFVQKKFNLTFTKGVLTKADLENPSEALAFIQLPIDVAKSIISIPTALFEYRVHQISDDNRLLTAQQQNLQLQKQIIDAQRALASQGSAS